MKNFILINDFSYTYNGIKSSEIQTKKMWSKVPFQKQLTNKQKPQKITNETKQNKQKQTNNNKTTTTKQTRNKNNRNPKV